MTNLEFYKDEINNRMKKEKVMCAICLTKNCPSECCDIKCPENEHLIDWLCEEYKEPIKLKQWEYDYIQVVYHEDEGDEVPIIHSLIDRLMEYGHFKSLKNMDLCIIYPQDILDNCIIVADDYDGFEDTK